MENNKYRAMQLFHNHLSQTKLLYNRRREKRCTFKICFFVKSSVLEAVGFDAASTASASALPLPIAVILLVAILPTKLEAPYRFQNPKPKSLSWAYAVKIRGIKQNVMGYRKPFSDFILWSTHRVAV